MAKVPQRLSGETPTNLLLRGLPQSSYEAIRPHLHRVSLAAGRAVVEPEQPIVNVYFPETGALSTLVRLRDGSTVEVNLVGNEGFAPVVAFLGPESAPIETRVVVRGEFVRIPAGTLRELAVRDRALLERLDLYVATVLTMRAYSVACDRRHPILPRLARLLLSAQDRVAAGSTLALTQDLLATMLGVARPSVTTSALQLQEAGLISYRRGRVRILDRAGLEAAAFECYRVIRNEVARLTPGLAGPARIARSIPAEGSFRPALPPD